MGDYDKCIAKPNCGQSRKMPFYQKLDRRAKELETSIAYLKHELESNENRLKGLKELRKTINANDERKIQALIDAELI